MAVVSLRPSWHRSVAPATTRCGGCTRTSLRQLLNGLAGPTLESERRLKCTKECGRAALSRAGLQVRWTTVPTADAARALESRIISTLADTGLWNRGKTVVPKFRD
jgi:hypothetical protein